MSSPVLRIILSILFVVIAIFRFSVDNNFGGVLSLVLAVTLAFSKPKDNKNGVPGKASFSDWERMLSPLWYDAKNELATGRSMAEIIANKARFMNMPAVFVLKQLANKMHTELAKKLIQQEGKAEAMTQLKSWTQDWTSQRPEDGQQALNRIEPEVNLLFAMRDMECHLSNGQAYKGLLLISTSHLLFIDLPASNPENTALLQQIDAVPLSMGASEGEIYQVGLFKQELLNSDGMHQLKLPDSVRKLLQEAFARNLSLALNLADVSQLEFTAGGLYATSDPRIIVTTGSPFQFQWAGGKAFALHQGAVNAVLQGSWLSGNPLLENGEQKGTHWMAVPKL